MLDRRQLMHWIVLAMILSNAAAAEGNTNKMNVICHIRYQIDPFKRSKFEEYAKAWYKIIPACGGILIGYFMPHEGTNDVAHALIGFESLAAYESYRVRLRSDSASVENFTFAENEHLIVREEREFLRMVHA